jgi:hypothetical protein
MFARFARSWQLVKASAAVLKQDHQLLIFPLISLVASLAVAAGFLLPLFGLGALNAQWESQSRELAVLRYGFAFLFYFSQYLVIFFFNTALVGAAMIRLEGGVPSLGAGLRIASSKFGSILGYALIGATIGMILRALQERVGFVGAWIVGLLGVGWTVATYLVVPVLAARDVGPVAAIKESAQILKRTWGENVIGQASLGTAFMVIHLAIVLCGIFLVLGAANAGSLVLLVLAVLIAVSAVLIAALVHAALSGIYSAALYRYATQGEGSDGFDPHALQQAFLPKK